MVFGSQYHRAASSLIELAIHCHSLFSAEIILHNAIVIISGLIVVEIIMIVLQCDSVVVVIYPTAVLKMVQEISYFMLAPPSLGKANHSDKTLCPIFSPVLQRLCVMSLVTSFHKTEILSLYLSQPWIMLSKLSQLKQNHYQ